MYPQGKKVEVFTTTGGNPYFNLNATTGIVRVGPWPTTVMVRAAAWQQTSTNVKPAVISIRLSSGAGGTATTTVIKTITTVTTGAAGTYGRGSTFYTDALRTIVSAGTDLFAVPTTAASKVRGKLTVYVDVQPFDLANTSARATKSA